MEDFYFNRQSFSFKKKNTFSTVWPGEPQQNAWVKRDTFGIMNSCNLVFEISFVR